MGGGTADGGERTVREMDVIDGGERKRGRRTREEGEEKKMGSRMAESRLIGGRGRLGRPFVTR